MARDWARLNTEFTVVAGCELNMQFGEAKEANSDNCRSITCRRRIQEERPSTCGRQSRNVRARGDRSKSLRKGKLVHNGGHLGGASGRMGLVATQVNMC
jgi:hypothetical protein